MSISVVIHTCDKYEFCWEGWAYYFNKYWDFRLPWDIHFMNEHKEVEFSSPRIRQLKTGEGAWSDRLKRGLEVINTDYILYMQEDMWLQEPIYERMFNYLYQLCYKHRWNKLTLTSVSQEALNNCREVTKHSYNGIPVYKILNNELYLMSHQPTFWKKRTLLNTLTISEDPWSHEKRVSRLLSRADKDLGFYHYFQDAPGIIQKWYTCVSRRGLTKEGFRLLKEVKSEG